MAVKIERERESAHTSYCYFQFLFSQPIFLPVLLLVRLNSPRENLFEHWNGCFIQPGCPSSPIQQCQSTECTVSDCMSADCVFGCQTSASDADQIYSAISSRAQKLKSSTATTATNQLSPVSNEAALSTSSSITSVAEKRSNESVADNDLALAEKRRRFAVLLSFCI